MAADDQKHVVVDHAIVMCKTCGRHRTFWFDKPIVGAEELIAWTKTVPRCRCGADTFDLKAHMKNAAEL